MFSKFIRHIKGVRSKIHSIAAKTPLYNITLFSFLPKRVQNRLNNTFSSEYSADLVSQSHIVVLKCTGRPVFIRDISAVLMSENLSGAEKAELHRFEWISILNHNMDKQWRQLIRQHIVFWVKNFKNDSSAWNISTISERIYNWIMQYNILSKTSDKNFNMIFLESLMQQFKFIKRQMYLPMNLLSKVRLIRAIIVISAAIGESITEASNELVAFLREINCVKACQTSYEILNVVRNLIEIQSVLQMYKKPVPNEIVDAIEDLSDITRFIRHPDGGISIFQSDFTPSPAYIDSLLSAVEYKSSVGTVDSQYIKLQAVNGYAFINLRDKYFPLEFSEDHQRIILGTYLSFQDQNLSGSELFQSDHSIYKEKNNIWFSGKSEFSMNDREITFEKKLYINSSGTDIRCEELISGQPFDFTYHIILPGDIDISLLEYQVGFFIDFKNGARWSWNFNKEAKFSFDCGKVGILNGSKNKFTILSIKQEPTTKLRWSLKKHK